MFKPLVKLLKALSSNRDPGAIACAFALGAVLGVMPKDNLLWYVLFVFVLFMRIQRGALTLAILLFSAIAFLFDPIFHRIGYYFLSMPSLTDTYVKLSNIPFVAFTKFNNTIVMGSLVCGICAYIPLYFLGRLLIFVWRRYVGNGFRKLKIVQIIKKIPLVGKIAHAVQEL